MKGRKEGAGKKHKDKRNWKKYEAGLIERKKKFVEFFFKTPTKEELEDELRKMNEGKVGRRFEIPDSILKFFEFLKHCFRMDDRTEVLFLSRFLSIVLGINRIFDHSAIVKRRAKLDFDLPFKISPEKLQGKVLYFDGMCLRVGRGGYYRGKEFGTPVKYLRIGIFVNDEGKVVDFVIGEEDSAEVDMIREKLPQIKRSRAKAFVSDGAGSAKDIVVELQKGKVRPIIKANRKVVESMSTKPPPFACAKRRSYEEEVWRRYAAEQLNYDRWKKESGYTKRWIFSEGKFSSFKRMFGEETVSKTQRALHDEICIKFMLLDGPIPNLWKENLKR